MGTREDSDEAYAVRLCNRVLGETALTQHKFDWLLGDPSENGIDADIAYGQLLRRMTSEALHTRYALVVPSASVKAVERVPAHVRRLLRIDLYEVTDGNTVHQLPT
ncbi:hypothetical protein [Streptomyces tanashiensis]|uniref:hypothetical protein n=1 Tax=Streptomyces tanashiensis TaxID=67367 RepID=UPI0033CE196F